VSNVDVSNVVSNTREGRQKDPDPDRPTEILLFISIARNKIISLGK
jgi:hypothetical protein